MSLLQTFNNLTSEPPLHTPTVFLQNEMQYNCIKNHGISENEMDKKDLSGWRSDDSLDIDSRHDYSNKLDCEISFHNSLTGKSLAPKKASKNSPGMFVLVILYLYY